MGIDEIRVRVQMANILPDESASFRELCAVMQRGLSVGHNIFSEMARKSMIEADSSLNLTWRLSPFIRADIQNIFNNNQFDLEFPDLFADQKINF